MSIKAANPQKPYPAVGHCIYCGSTDEPLTLEHIIAEGLGGNLLLPKASCEPCRQATHRAETICQGRMWGKFRRAANFHSKHKKKASGILRMETRSDGGMRQVMLLRPSEYPRALAMARLPPPGILVGRLPGTPAIGGTWHAFDKRDVVLFPRDKNVHMGRYEHYPFCRMLAKIAHSYAAAELGEEFETYTPLATDFIRERTDISPMAYIGGELDVPPPEPNVLQSLARGRRYIGQTEYLLVTIRLFAFMGAPIYYVLVGRRPKPPVQPAADQAA